MLVGGFFDLEESGVVKIGIEVSGTLDVNGASGNEVQFVSNASSPAPGDWTGIQLLSGSAGTLDFAEICPN